MGTLWDFQFAFIPRPGDTAIENKEGNEEEKDKGKTEEQKIVDASEIRGRLDAHPLEHREKVERPRKVVDYRRLFVEGRLLEHPPVSDEDFKVGKLVKSLNDFAEAVTPLSGVIAELFLHYQLKPPRAKILEKYSLDKKLSPPKVLRDTGFFNPGLARQPISQKKHACI